jgi:AcrR family transcriptional regulator
MIDNAAEAGLTASRRRTRRAIVAAAARLVADGREPSIGDVAAAAEVSRRTIYLYFPTLDQLLLDATLAAMTTEIDTVLDGLDGLDVRTRVDRLVTAVCELMDRSLPLGRKLIKLTVDATPTPGTPKRGYRRIQWIERALDPLRDELTPDHFERLVSMLAMIIGWEAYLVLYDVRGLDNQQARQTTRTAALAILDTAVSHARAPGAG